MAGATAAAGTPAIPGLAVPWSRHDRDGYRINSDHIAARSDQDRPDNQLAVYAEQCDHITGVQVTRKERVPTDPVKVPPDAAGVLWHEDRQAGCGRRRSPGPAHWPPALASGARLPPSPCARASGLSPAWWPLLALPDALDSAGTFPARAQRLSVAACDVLSDFVLGRVLECLCRIARRAASYEESA